MASLVTWPVASGEDEERATDLPIAEHSDPVDEVAMPSLSIPDVERMQWQLAESSGMGQAVERMQQQMAMPATVLADAVAHVKQQMAMPTAQLAEAVGRLQQMGAPSSQFLLRKRDRLTATVASDPQRTLELRHHRVARTERYLHRLPYPTAQVRPADDSRWLP